jgi:hypothetical protein
MKAAATCKHRRAVRVDVRRALNEGRPAAWCSQCGAFREAGYYARWQAPKTATRLARPR